jgi:hypothetical protein
MATLLPSNEMLPTVTFISWMLPKVTEGPPVRRRMELNSNAEDVSLSLDRCMDFACVFEHVKAVVKNNLGLSRAGLMLGLTDLPRQVGGFHGVGGNLIVMNRRLLDIVVRSAQNRRQINAYVFYILLHEYLHALGFLSEAHVRQLSVQLCEKALGLDHPATHMAKYGIGAVLRGMGDLDFQTPEEELGVPRDFEIVSDFDHETSRWFV